MFTQKRKNYKTFLYAAVILLLCILILALAWPQDASESGDLGQKSENLQERTAGLLEIQSDNDEPSSSSGQVDNDASIQPKREENSASENFQADDSEKKQSQNTDNNADDSEKTDMNSDNDSYYLVKRADGAVKIFFVSGVGKVPVELETTNILYDVLGPEDQKLFDEGYRVKTQDELAVLLQDFES